MARGGKRLGAGRKPVPAELKKMPISIKLPKWLIDWLDEQGDSRPNVIERALCQQYGIQPPVDEAALSAAPPPAVQPKPKPLLDGWGDALGDELGDGWGKKWNED